jgi:hypothetical protein
VSILSDPAIVELFKTRFIPVAIDQHDHRRLKDAEGELFARILKQAGRRLDGAAQGFYLVTPAGKLLEFENTLSGERMKAMLTLALKKFDPAAPVPQLEPAPADRRSLYTAPEGALVVNVNARVLGGYDDSRTRKSIYETALGTDHLWIRKDEAEQLVKGSLPESLKVRLVRFHLVDNTRGEPPFWKADEIQQLDLKLDRGRLSGTVKLASRSGQRGFEGRLLGVVRVEGGKVTGFDVVARGDYWGEGPFTRGAPKGRFPFAVAFRLSEGGDQERRIPPGGARGNVKGYLQ